MTDISLKPKPEREQERHASRRSNFYNQTCEQNNQRLNGKPKDFDSLLEEIKFIESELLARFGNEL